MEKITKIGRVKLDYGHYGGSDLYSDGRIEQDILELVKNEPPDTWPVIIEEKADWAYLYHLSPLRQNIIEWLPIKQADKVLEIGSGCGALTGMLAERAGEVVCVDLSAKRSHINAHRNAEYENITIHVGNFADIWPDLPADFDFILFIGVFEYSGLYLADKDPYVGMLRIARSRLKADGHLAIAIENRLGLKYWAGAAEDHLGTFFSGLEGYADAGHARTFSQGQLSQILVKAGISDYHFYYPYPDYKFMTTLFSDDRLPQKGELYDNARNFDRHRMELFNEKKVFDSLIADGLFPLFANSFFIYTGADTDITYLRYSNDRAPAYRVRTKISKDFSVEKTPLGSAAEAHVQRMLETSQVLLNDFDDSGLAICTCRSAPDGRSVRFRHVRGISLAEYLDECSATGDRERLDAALEKFYALCVCQSGGQRLINRDLIFSNILLDADAGGRFTLIDYEWMLEGEQTATQAICRALHCYLAEDAGRQSLDAGHLYEKWGISAADVAACAERERHFQEKVAGGRMSVAQIREACGMIAVDPKRLLAPYIARAAARHVQLFFDNGTGFSEEGSIHLLEAYQNENDVEIDVTVPANVKRLRLDPADAACAVKIESVAWNGVDMPLGRKSVRANGKRIAEGYYIFLTDDPNLHINIGCFAKRSGAFVPAVTPQVFNAGPPESTVTPQVFNAGSPDAGNHLEMRLNVVMLPR